MIHYIDPDSGNDANSGASFALAWKTINGGATAGNLAAGDTVRIKASPAPTSLGQLATWTTGSAGITLSSSVTANIEVGNTTWTASSNVTGSNTATTKTTVNFQQLAINSSFTTGLVAYKAFSVTDFSSYQQVSFWFRSTVANMLTDNLEIRLCSDNAGVTAVNTIQIPATGAANLFQPVTVDTGGALGASIQSVAIYRTANTGAATVIIGNILACKASSSADSLTLTSLIGKNTGEPYMAISSINGTAVRLDQGPNTLSVALKGYFGVTESVTTYKRETFTVPVGVFTGTSKVGTVGNAILYSGGWDRTNMSTQVAGEGGYSYFTGQNGGGNGFSIDHTYNNIEYLGFCRFTEGLQFDATSCGMSNVRASNNSDCGVFIFTAASISCYLNNCYSVFNANLGLHDATAAQMIPTINTLGCYSNNSHGLSSGAANVGENSLIKNLTCLVNGGWGVNIGNGNTSDACVNTIFYNLTTSGNASGAVVCSVKYTKVAFVNAVMNESTKVSFAAATQSNALMSFQKYNGTSTDHRIFMEGGTIASDSSTVHTTGTGAISWKLSPTSTVRSVTYPLPLPLGPIGVTANKLVTINTWLRRDNTGVTLNLIVPGNQISGVASDVVYTASASANTWELATVSFTPTETGVIMFGIQAYGGTTLNGWVDDVSFS